MDSLILGMNDVDVFVGYGIPDFDSATPVQEQDGVFGVSLKNVDLGMVLLTAVQKNLNVPTQIALKAHADQVALAGLGDLMQVTADGVDVYLNWASAWKDAPTKRPTVNFEIGRAHV